MSELLSEVAIVRQQEQPLTLRIEPADIEQARKLWRQQIKDRVARVRIASSRNKSRRFVQRDRRCALEMNELAIDFYMIALVRLRTEIGANPAIDRDASSRDQFITFSPRQLRG